MSFQSMRGRAIHYARQPLTRLYAAWMPASLQGLLDRQGRTGDSAISDYDALSLYRTVLKRRPNCILELGAGYSSAVIALAIKDAGYKPRFVAIEEDPQWLTHHVEATPEDLRQFVEYRQSNVSTRNFGGVKAAYYSDLPSLPYEMIHVDGPQLANNGVRASCDPINLKDDLGENCVIMFDAREDTVRLLKKELATAGFSMRRHPMTFMCRLERTGSNLR